MKIFGLVITTEKKKIIDYVKAYNKGFEASKKFYDKSAWTAINPVIHDLECLRANTWDQDKITYIQNWLRNNFEVK